MVQVEQFRSERVVVGVDTDKHVHVATVMNSISRIVGTPMIPTGTEGYRHLLERTVSFGRTVTSGTEDTGSHGFVLASFVCRTGYKVVEIDCPERCLRLGNGKSDTLDAEYAAKAISADYATAVPKSADGPVDMIR